MSKNNTKWIIKIGSSLLTNNGKGLDKSVIENWVSQIVSLKKKWHIDVILVSSGAITEGMKRLGWKQRPDNIYKLQAAAAVGQMGLIEAYEHSFSLHKIHTAQILLTHDNLKNSKRYDNIRNTLIQLLSMKVVPVINENDTVSTEEICFGDNDILAALVANLIDADKLIILTDQVGIFDADPRFVKNARLIKNISIQNPILKRVASKMGGHFGRGGMYSKVIAAEQAKISNTKTHVVSGKSPSALIKIAENKPIGTIISDTQ